MYGVLQMHYLHTGWGHSVCGPWGCGPSLEALLGYHGFWFLLGVPGVLWAWQNLAASRPVLVGKLLCLLAAAVLTVWAAVDAAQWWTASPSHFRGLVVQRFLFTVVTMVNVPLLPSSPQEKTSRLKAEIRS